MANFITSSTLLRIDAGSPGDPQPLSPPEVLGTYPGMLATVADAMTLIPPGQRPPPSLWGAYALRYNLAAYVRVHFLGITVPHGRAVFDIDCYAEPNGYLLRQPPLLRNSFEIDYGRTVDGRDLLSEFRQLVQAYLIAASQRDDQGDRRDFRLAITKAPGHPLDRLDLIRNSYLRQTDGLEMEF